MLRRQSVKAAGPFMVSLGFFVILPLMWQLPICLITAELTTTFQVRMPLPNLLWASRVVWAVVVVVVLAQKNVFAGFQTAQMLSESAQSVTT